MSRRRIRALSAFKTKVGDTVLRATPIGGYAVPLGHTQDVKKSEVFIRKVPFHA